MAAVLLLLAGLVSGCGAGSDKPVSDEIPQAEVETMDMVNKLFTADTTVAEVVSDPAFGDFGRLLFPVDRAVPQDMTLAEVSNSSVHIWYSNIHTEQTVEIVNYLKGQAECGAPIFYPIYTDDEIAKDPSKEDTGLFFFQGEPGAKFAIVNAGGGFVYVGAMHDSFPQALELSKRGCNAFALIYRPDSAYSDLAQAIAYLYDHAEELGIDRNGYSLWGGSAGARMAATLGNADGLAYFGRPDIPQAAAVMMQYTGYSTASAKDAPTYACVGDGDGIASWQTMKRRLEQLSAMGIPTEFHVYRGLSHGFGLGTDTAAEGWLEDAVDFWERQTQ
jgi:acetyl esterase/lipase